MDRLRLGGGLLLSMTLLVGSGCRSAHPVGVASPRPAPQISDGLHWMRNSAEHRAVFLQTYAWATRELDRLAAGRAPGTWAVISDADETILDTSSYQKERDEAGRAFSQETWEAWVLSSPATPVPGAVAFFRHVKELGGKVAVVTNRGASLCPVTEDNLRSIGVPFDVVLCRTPESAYKEARFERVATGQASLDLPPLEILMWLGDNIQDFPQQRQALRHAADAELRSFGTRFIIFPNPVYGSWVANPRE